MKHTRSEVAVAGPEELRPKTTPRLLPIVAINPRIHYGGHYYYNKKGKNLRTILVPECPSHLALPIPNMFVNRETLPSFNPVFRSLST